MTGLMIVQLCDAKFKLVLRCRLVVDQRNVNTQDRNDSKQTKYQHQRMITSMVTPIHITKVKQDDEKLTNIRSKAKSQSLTRKDLKTNTKL